LADNFWENVERYRKLGFDPLRWVSACSTEADTHIVKQALSEVKKSTIKVAPSWFDPYFHIANKEPELTRRVYDLAGPAVDKEVEVKRALAIFRVHSQAAESPQALSEVLSNFFAAFKAKVAVASAPVATTEHPDAQFALLDYIELRRGDKDGYMPALSSFTQVTDITKEPDDDIHVKIAMTDAIERLNLLGCGNPALFKFFPIYDAPTEEMLDRIRINLDAFMSRYNLVMEDYSSLKRGKLFYGTSAISITNKELPTRYEQVEEGMEIMMTNKFGGLAAASLHALALSDPANADRFEKAGVPVAEITAARDAAIKSLSEPHFALGKIISKYCPDFGQAFDKNAHITAVYPVGPRGIFALGALAELANAGLAINDIPVRDGEISRLAANESLVENATASQHGCHVLVATKDVLNLVAEEMRQHHFAPETIGTVAKKGAPSVTIEKDAGQYVANKAKLARLLAPAS
jgi:selenophosphate synthase